MKQRTYESRSENPLRRTRVPMTADLEEVIDVAHGLWHETPDEIAAAINEGYRREELLQWVYGQMRRRLTLRERTCVILYYLGPCTLREIAARLHVSPPTVLRNIRDGIQKLRRAAASSKSPVVRKALRRK